MGLKTNPKRTQTNPTFEGEDESEKKEARSQKLAGAKSQKPRAKKRPKREAGVN